MKGWLSVWASAETGASQINLTSLGGGCWPAGFGSAAVLPADAAAAAAAAKEVAEFVPRAGHSVQSERSETPG